MPPESSKQIQQVVFEGPLTLTAAVVCGLLAAGLIAWLFWTETRRTRPSLAIVFWMLRATAVAVVIWMLLGPSLETIDRNERVKSILLLVDGSPSMDVIDPSGRQDDIRWAMAARPDQQGRLHVACDCAAVAAQAAHQALERTYEPLRRGEPVTAVAPAVRAAQRALVRASDHLDRLSGWLEPLRTDFAGRARELSETVDGQILPPLEALVGQLDNSDTLVHEAVWGTLEPLIPRLARFTRQTSRFASDMVEEWESVLSPADRRQILTDRTSRRSELVSHMLAAADQSWLTELSKTARVRRYRFDSQTMPLGEAGENRASSPPSAGSATAANDSDPQSTNLSAALEQVRQAAASEPVHLAVLLTDGRHNTPDTRDPREIAAGLGRLPVHVVPIGHSEMLRDVVLHHLHAPAAVVADDRIVLDAMITAYAAADETCVVELTAGGRLIERREIEISGDRSDHRLVFATKEHEIGRHQFQLRVEPLADEADLDNNLGTVSVDVVEDSLTVLLSDQLPRWEYRYLVNLFTRDENVECDELLFGPQRRGTGRFQSDPSFPRDADGWARYRIVLLGDVGPDVLDPAAQESLREYVTRRGGTLVVLAGRDHMPHDFIGGPLESLIPVSLSPHQVADEVGYSLEMTAAARRLDAMSIADDPAGSDRVWREMSRVLPIYWLSDYAEAKRTAHTLINAVPRDAADQTAKRAFLCWQTVGRGRVVYLAAPATYQLRLRAGDRFHYRFWGQLIRWAVARELAPGSKTVRIRTDKSNYAANDPVDVVVQLTDLEDEAVRNADVVAVAHRNDSVEATVPLREDENIPGRYLGQFASLPAGEIRIEPGGSAVADLLAQERAGEPVQTTITVQPTASDELRDTRSNRPLLAQVAELTGGQVVQPTALAEIVQFADLSPQVTEQRSKRPMWNTWTALWLVLGCLTAEWIVRKRTGLA